MIRIKDIDHIVLRVRDLEAMVDFYCRVLGCSVERRRPDLGLVHLRAGLAQIDLVPVEGMLGKMGGAAPGKEGRNLDHVCLRLHDFDLDAIVKHLEANSVRVGDVAPRFGAEGVSVSVYLHDPEDNMVELKGAKI